MIVARTLSAILMITGAVHVAYGESPSYDPARLSFHVKFRDESSAYRVLAVPVLPNETLRFQVVDETGGRAFTAEAETGDLALTAPLSWEWVAPAEKGLHPVRIRTIGGEETMTLNVFVTVPTGEVREGYLNGYRIGDYFWAKPWDKLIYRAPPGLIEAAAGSETTHVSPHFTLGQFFCKQSGGYPKYLILRERLLRKLERILEATNAAGYRCDTFAVLSGYRTPWYNRSIGNVKYSRHVWGGAADIYIDESPNDGMMDDLNGDGAMDIHDAKVLYNIIDALYRRPWWEPLVGGLGRYRKTSAHGPFVHVDARGTRTRWGD